MSIIFSQASIFHLYRLGTMVSGKTGTRYTLSIEKERLDLIRFCDASTDSSIQRQMGAFVESLDANTLRQLEAQRLLSPERAMWHTHKIAL